MMVDIIRTLMVINVVSTTYSQAIRLPASTPLPSLMDTMSIRTIIEGLGMVYESYDVVTDDGYILNLNRMVNPNLRNTKDKGKPVLLVNGLAMWSDAWFIQPIPVNNPPVAWLLRGYDVWLGDQRGTWRSRRHKTMSTVWWKFWDFSHHEMAVYDLPAFIDFILHKTGHEKVAYSGVSNSASYYYILCAEKPEYNDKLYGAILFAPVGVTPQLTTMRWGEILNIVDGSLIMKSLWAFGIGPYPPLPFLSKMVIYAACRLATPQLFIQISEITMGSGCEFHKDVFCRQISMALGGSSAKAVVHVTQLFTNGGSFGQYDYGVIGNLIKYRQVKPLEYNLTNIRAPTAFYYTDIDVWAPSRMVDAMASRFQGPVYKCETPGVCHVFHLCDPRSGPFISDTSDAMDSMTGRENATKRFPGKCEVKW